MRWLLFVALSLLAGAGALFIVLIDAEPLVTRTENLSPSAVAQARRLFLFNDPRRMLAGEQRRVALPATLIDEGINYLASRALHGRGALVLGEDSAETRLTLRVPWPRWLGERFLNLRAIINESQGEPRIAAAAIGATPIPQWLAEFTLLTTVRAVGYGQEWDMARGAVRRLTFEPRQGVVLVDFVWQPALLDKVRGMAIDAAELPRFEHAHRTLVTLLDHKAPKSAMPLRQVLRPMLEATAGQQPRQRRAALLVLALYIAEKNLAHLIPVARQWPQPHRVTLTLRDREDSAQHFVVSAALAAWAGEPAAEAIGVYKELDDARHGSGFSFADLAADRAGTRFGELVLRQPERIDALLRTDIADTDLMPSQEGLPEYLYQPEFRRRYGGPGTPAYRAVEAEIERRLAALPLYR
ncbi:MAG: hypothetical protein IPN12_09355 [Rhodocyclaceae bacterium]|nr:hypothetical protein [Rhodocyclaceae bacterium]MBK6553773.1 hypothetical protein [Rhodocyclaceae bacterium]MBK6678289.1 hypothetical protein [Rhodocyclaceae bacterium]MBK9310950.1 hypothetical protein [Rhodocyclaceae bacterium]